MTPAQEAKLDAILDLIYRNHGILAYGEQIFEPAANKPADPTAPRAVIDAIAAVAASVKGLSVTATNVGLTPAQDAELTALAATVQRIEAALKGA